MKNSLEIKPWYKETDSDRYEKFVEKSIEKHGDRYAYEKIGKLRNFNKKVKVECEEHGYFLIGAHDHIRGSGCKKCHVDKLNKLKPGENHINYSSSNDRKNHFINLSIKIHGDRYDYSRVEYKTARIKVEILCKEHGSFLQLPYNHTMGKGCIKCSMESTRKKLSKTQEDFLKDCEKIHGNKYDYSKSIYKNWETNIEIICRDHGSFWQTPNGHLTYENGCKRCNLNKGREKIIKYFNNAFLTFGTEKTFEDCFYKNILRFDFYVEKYNLLIEYDGMQHYKPVKFFGGEKSFKLNKIRDNIKNEHCKNSPVLNLLRISYLDYDKVEYIIDDCIRKIENGEKIFIIN